MIPAKLDIHPSMVVIAKNINLPIYSKTFICLKVTNFLYKDVCGHRAR
ncbi:conserved domain protein [Bacteroides fluxus YIT 12057]|uniref:Conserved domain protein n=1 Tax=Bacteroides fluxus YIT 12057 TaxID=763034 RepID=F3PYK0_9BACE|nr:conserved domain protein [Bacteroides fluxus YIT 12057]